jgi:putative hydrolase of the HAD superfamily
MALCKDIRAVTFDVGGTLIRPWPSVGHVYGKVAEEHGHKKINPEILNQQFAAGWQAKKHFDHSRAAWFDLVKKTFAGLADERAVGDFFDDLYDRFASPAAWRVFDDVHCALESLRGRGLRLGIISNWDERLRPLLAQLQLDHIFEPTIISIEVGFAKPSAGIFQRAASALCLDPRRVLHVGDSRAEDFSGARAAGFQAILLDRETFTDTNASSISTLSELSSLL